MSRYQLGQVLGGAFGAGLVLVVLPSAALFGGLQWINSNAAVGLPLLAIFGIMILFGAMAITSTLFTRLGLGNRNEALALPTGSVRAAIAMSLIVLFAIISIMVFRTLAEPYRLRGLTEKQKLEVLSEPRNRVLAVRGDECDTGAATPPGAAASGPAPAQITCFQVHLVPTAGQEAMDMAKQLLILIGTLMTSVTSFYFAAPRSAATDGMPPQRPGIASPPVAVPPAPPAPTPPGAGTPPATNGAPAASAATATSTSSPDDHADGCDLSTAQSEQTPDERLPAATGGVA